jgi:hypothetical protein
MTDPEPTLTPEQAHKVEETIQELEKEIPAKPKVRGSWLQNLLRAKYFMLGMTIVMMFLVFGTAIIIAYRTGGPERPVSAEDVKIIPEATIVFPEEEEEVEVSTESSEIKEDPTPTPETV